MKEAQAPHTAPVIEKVCAYITHGHRLLVFSHPEHPQAGIQVPAGTVEPDETPLQAVLREAQEETGLTDLEVRAYLGMREHDLRPWGREAIERRHYFHLACLGSPPETWRHHEMHPSDGTEGPILFSFLWVALPDLVPELTGEQGEMLGALGKRRTS